MFNPIIPLISQLESPANLDLDHLLESLHSAGQLYEDLYVRTIFYEKELQRELKALIDLAGPIPACTCPQDAFTLKGEPLLLARREARLLYNSAFRISPVRRQN